MDRVFGQIEDHSMQPIPANLRHGKPFDLFTLWFGPLIVFVTLITGADCAAAGLSIWWIVVAIIVGDAIGVFLTAAHSAQGPTLGLPQMVQSRAQFGYLGTILPLLMALFNFMGFLPTNPAVAGQALNSLWGLNTTVGIVIVALLGFVLAVFGYSWVHRIAKVTSVLGLLTFLVFLGLLMFAHPVIAGAKYSNLHGGFVLGPFLEALVLTLVFAASFAPWAADYSRYLPASSNRFAVGAYSALGLGIPIAGLFILGAYLEVVSNYNLNITGVMDSVAKSGGQSFLTIFNLVAVAILILETAMCAYSSAILLEGIIASLRLRSFRHLTATSVVQTAPSRQRRIVYLFILSLIGIGAAIAYSENLLGFYGAFLSILVLLIIPWSAVNLTDFYFIRRGHYSVTALFQPRGPYGLINKSGFISYFCALGIEFLFANISGVYESPVAHALGGGDISWIPGVLIAGGLYLALNWRLRTADSAEPEAQTVSAATGQLPTSEASA
jgi:nucleobase:cation symporter-1, NCS1 family